MGVEYRAVQWNRQKRVYDLVLVGGVGLFLIGFGVLSKVLFPYVTDEIMLMRAFGTAAFLLLHIILCIGPLCRLNPKFLPLLYNRRHAGVTMCSLALVHAALVILTYHAGGDTNPILGIFVSTPVTGPFAGVPFQPFGFFALVILFLMAATSHDFWLANLSAPVWKSLHMLVYVAYGLLVLHVTFGILQSELSPVYVTAVAIGFTLVLGLHIAAALKEAPVDRDWVRSRRREEADSVQLTPNRLLTSAATNEGFIDVCAVEDIPEKRARIVCLSGERVAIFKYDGKVSAVSNVCEHQNGPLGEGKILDGCITCPWHGYQYLPETGASPPPFVEKVPTFNVRIQDGRVLVHPKPNPAGVPAEPALIGSRRREEAEPGCGKRHILQEPPPHVGGYKPIVNLPSSTLPIGIETWPPLWQAAALFLSTFVLEDVAAVGAGLLMATGNLGWPWAFGSCFLGIWSGDAGLYGLARVLGRTWFDRTSLRRFSSRLEQSEIWFSQRGNLILVFSRLMPGARLPTYLAAGLLRLPFSRFLFITGIASLAWTVVVLLAAQVLGTRLLTWLGSWRQTGWAFLLVVPVLWLVLHFAKKVGQPGAWQHFAVWFQRWKHWEFWPAWMFYPPVAL